MYFFSLLDIQPGQVSTEEQDRLESNIKELDQFLGPYPYERFDLLENTVCSCG